MHQDSISHDILIFWKCFNGLKNTFVYQIKKFVPSFFKVYPNRFLYLHTFLRKTLWKLYDPFITFRLQMWRMNYLHISKSFSVTNSVSGFNKGLVEILGMSALPDSVIKLVPKIPEKDQKRLDLISKSARDTVL